MHREKLRYTVHFFQAGYNTSASGFTVHAEHKENILYGVIGDGRYTGSRLHKGVVFTAFDPRLSEFNGRVVGLQGDRVKAFVATLEEKLNGEKPTTANVKVDAPWNDITEQPHG